MFFYQCVSVQSNDISINNLILYLIESNWTHVKKKYVIGSFQFGQTSTTQFFKMKKMKLLKLDSLCMDRAGGQSDQFLLKLFYFTFLFLGGAPRINERKKLILRSLLKSSRRRGRKCLAELQFVEWIWKRIRNNYILIGPGSFKSAVKMSRLKD